RSAMDAVVHGEGLPGEVGAGGVGDARGPDAAPEAGLRVCRDVPAADLEVDLLLRVQRQDVEGPPLLAHEGLEGTSGGAVHDPVRLVPRLLHVSAVEVDR